MFRDTLTKANIIRELFDTFNQQLEKAKLITRAGTIVDATFIEAPRQQNNQEEKDDIKQGKIPEEWKKPENIHKLRQKDTDARWTRKGNQLHYGYKNHVKADAESKLIVDYAVTDASVHDSKVICGLLDGKDKVLYADSAYWGKPVEEGLPETVENRIHERGTKKQPLSEEQKANNRIKAKTRARIEHIFGFMTMSMHGLTVRSIGMARTEFNVGLTNLIYNLYRYEFLNRPKETVG